jgi:hypothetical protein
MKKYIVLFVLVAFLVGCSLMTPPAVRVDNAIERAGRQYAITQDVSVNVLGNRAQDIEEVFSDFGFRISTQPDYTVQVEVENLGWGQSWGYYMYPAKIRMRVQDNRTGREYFYKADGVFRYFVSYGYYGYNSTWHYPADPYGLAAKIAATEAIGDFIEEQRIPHHWPPKPKPRQATPWGER